MYVKRLEVMTEVLDKINGKTYRVTKVDDDGENKIGYTNEILEDDTLGQEGVAITAENCRLFRVLKDAAPSIPEGYTLNDGIILKGGTPVCEQGQYYILSIIAKQPGALILTAKTEGEEDSVDIIKYDVNRDRFKMLCHASSNVALVGTVGNTVILAYNKIEDETRSENGENKIVRVFKESKLIRIGTKKTSFYDFNQPVVVEDMKIAIPQYTQAQDDNLIDYYIFYPVNTEVVDGIVKETSRVWYNLHKNTPGNICIGLDGDIEVTWSPSYEIFTAKNDSGLYVELSETIKTPKIKELDGFNILVDITYDGNNVKTYVFANDRYEMKSLICKETSDRGMIYTIQ